MFYFFISCALSGSQFQGIWLFASDSDKISLHAHCPTPTHTDLFTTTGMQTGCGIVGIDLCVNKVWNN